MDSTSVIVPFVDLAWQHQPLHAEIEKAIAQVIERGDFVLGEALAEFETAFAQACGVEYGIGVASGTDAIALGLKACGIGSGDEVIVPANTFIATVTGIIQAGATPVLADCDPHTALINLQAAEKVVTSKTKAIIPVHLYGQMSSPQQLLDFAASHQLIIFEDAAQAHLASREGYHAGGIGTAAAFSFYPSKNLGAFGNAGILVTDEPEVAQKMRSLRNYGAPSKYFYTELGMNSRLDTIQAAILKVKLPHLNSWNQLRNRAAQQYDRDLQILESQGITPIKNQSGIGNVYHLYVIRVAQECVLNRDQIRKKLTTLGIQTGIHYPIACHLQPAYRYLGYQLGDFPHTEALSQQILSLPMYPGLSRNQVKLVCETLAELLL